MILFLHRSQRQKWVTPASSEGPQGNARDQTPPGQRMKTGAGEKSAPTPPSGRRLGGCGPPRSAPETGPSARKMGGGRNSFMFCEEKTGFDHRPQRGAMPKLRNGKREGRESRRWQCALSPPPPDQTWIRGFFPRFWRFHCLPPLPLPPRPLPRPRGLRFGGT